MKFFIKKKMLIVICFLFVGFILVQFIQPNFENPPVTGEITVPAEVLLQFAIMHCMPNYKQYAHLLVKANER